MQHAELLAAAALGVTSVLLARPRSTAACVLPEAVPVASLQLVTLIKEGEHHVIEVREGFFDVKRKACPGRPLLRCYTRGLAEIYFSDVESNAA